MRLDYQIAILLAIATIPFGAAMMAAPLYWNFPKQHLALFFWGGLAFTLFFIAGTVFLAWRGEEAFAPTEYGRRVALGVMILCLLGLICSSIVYFWPDLLPQNSTQGVVSDRRPLTMREVFDSDFPRVGKTFLLQEVGIDGKRESFPATEYWDIATNSYFFAFYFNHDQSSPSFVELVASAIEAIKNNLGQVEYEITTPGDTKLLSNSTMKFSGEIYLYLERELTVSEQYEVESLFLKHNLNVHIRSAAYHALHCKEFDRHVLSATESNPVGVQLPLVTNGTTIRIRNRLGNLPPSTVVHLDGTRASPEPPSTTIGR